MLTPYTEKLEIVNETIEPVLEEVIRNGVVTPAHGKLFGKWIWPIPIRAYDHHPGEYVKELLNTPLHKLPFETRDEVEAGPLGSFSIETTVDQVWERLNAPAFTKL